MPEKERVMPIDFYISCVVTGMNERKGWYVLCIDLYVFEFKKILN
jgi:hypothetical protein